MIFEGRTATLSDAEVRLFDFRNEADDEAVTLSVDTITLLGLSEILKKNITAMREYAGQSRREGESAEVRRNRLVEMLALQEQRSELVQQFGQEVLVQCFAESMEAFEAR